MARVNSPYYLKGRIDCLQFYEIGSKRYVRMVSSLTGKKVKKSPAFARTRESYERLAKASPIASAVYEQLPKEMRINGYYEKMVGVIVTLVRDGYTVEQARALLYDASRPELYEALREADLRKAREAAGIGASVYYQLPAAMQIAGYEQALIDMAMQLLEEGLGVKEAYELLCKATMPEKEGIPSTLYVVSKEETCEKAGAKVQRLAFADEVFGQVFAISPAESAEYAENEAMYCDMPP